jgi:hypothetical protein
MSFQFYSSDGRQSRLLRIATLLNITRFKNHPAQSVTPIAALHTCCTRIDRAAGR